MLYVNYGTNQYYCNIGHKRAYTSRPSSEALAGRAICKSCSKLGNRSNMMVPTSWLGGPRHLVKRRLDVIWSDLTRVSCCSSILRMLCKKKTLCCSAGEGARFVSFG